MSSMDSETCFSHPIVKIIFLVFSLYQYIIEHKKLQDSGLKEKNKLIRWLM